MSSRLKRLVIGSPLPTKHLAHEQLDKTRGLAAFSPGALSSIAYANQEIYLGLIVAGVAGLSQSLPMALAITGLMALVALSYFQTVHVYSLGGGSYTVARENLGARPGLIAAAALMIDYLLTAAVSLTAGVEAIASAFPALWSYRIPLSLLFLSIITLMNLRGVRETGTLMAVPVYLFVLSYLSMLAYGGANAVVGATAPPTAVIPPATQPLTLLLLLHTFSTGCTALTGIEAISNGVPAFRPPQARNAGQTLIIMAILMGLLFIGSIGLTQFFGVTAGPQETILSALARRILGTGPAYLLIQASTMLILAVAANTSFAGFPRLTAVLAVDGFLPRQLSGIGDRLVYANGTLLLAIATGVLIIVFGGDTHALIPLFAVGAFLAFTLSQIGMVVHWLLTQGKGWKLKASLNGVGALATGVTLLVVGANKFLEGAWICVLLIPILLFGFLKTHSHYRDVDSQLSLQFLPETTLRTLPAPRVVVPISGVNKATCDAISYARSMSKNVTAVFVELETGTGRSIRDQWQSCWTDVPLVVLPSPYRSIVGPFLDFLDETDREHDDGQLAAVVLPEWVPAKWWQNVLHNQTARLIRNALLYHRRHLGFQRVIIEIPYHLRR